MTPSATRCRSWWGPGAPSARQAVALSRRAQDDGADALLVLSPPRSDDPQPYYEAVAAALVSGHRANARAGIAGLKRNLCNLYGTSPGTRLS